MAPNDEQANLDLLVQHAQNRLERQLGNSDALDAKALGVIAIAAAAIALLVAAHEAINRLWWLPTAGFVLASVFLIAVIRPREFDAGPDTEWLYNHWEEDQTTAADARREMLSELLLAVASPLVVYESVEVDSAAVVEREP